MLPTCMIGIATPPAKRSLKRLKSSIRTASHTTACGMLAENVLLYLGRPPCQTVFRACIQGAHFGYGWNGTQIMTMYEKKLYSNY